MGGWVKVRRRNRGPKTTDSCVLVVVLFLFLLPFVREECEMTRIISRRGESRRRRHPNHHRVKVCPPRKVDRLVRSVQQRKVYCLVGSIPTYMLFPCVYGYIIKKIHGKKHVLEFHSIPVMEDQTNDSRKENKPNQWIDILFLQPFAAPLFFKPVSFPFPLL